MAEIQDLSLRNALGIAVGTGWEGLRDAARQTPGWLALSGVLFGVQALIPAAEVWLLRHLVADLAMPAGDRPGLGLVLAGLTIVVGLNYPLGQIAVSAAQRMSFRLGLRYSTQLAYAAAGLSPARLADPQQVTDLEAADQAVQPMSGVPGSALQLAGTVITAAGLCVAICVINLPPGLLVLSALIPTVIAFTFIARLESARWPAVAAAERRARYAGEQLLQQRSATELATLGSGAKVAGIVTRYREQRMLLFDGIIRADMRWEAAASLGTAVLLAAALLTMINSRLSPALAAAAIAGILSGLSAVRFTGHAFGLIISASPHSRSYRSVVDSVDSADRVPIVSEVDQLEVRQLTVCYPGAVTPAVSDVSLIAGRGEIIALVGINGAGKTTTVNALLGVIKPSAGQVLIDHQDASRLSETERLAHFGLLTQEFGRYEFTVRDVIMLGTPADRIDDHDLWSALESARAADLVRSLPNQLNTQLGEQWGGVGLSGGQWQRLAMARVCLRNAGIWVLDEPTSAIDAEAEREIFAELQRSRAGRITIVVSHRAWTLRGMDRIYVFDHGRIVQTGRYEELLAEPGRFADLFAGQLDS